MATRNITVERATFNAAYQQAIAAIEKMVKAGQDERALRYAEYAASIVWLKPLLESFVDEHLEGLIEQVASKYLPCHRFEKSESTARRRAVLYNGQIIDTGALTEQYLNYLIDEGYDVLFIVQDIRNTVAGQGILRRLAELDCVEVLVLKSGARIKKIRQLHQAIVEFDPHCSFLHFLPNDVVGYAAFSRIVGRPRYYIVHNDHTFWLGKGCSDYFFEFRQLGVRIAIDRRGIDEAKVVNLPYYPIHSGVAFQGFPFDPHGKVIGLSGALLSKYFRDPELKYFHAIRRLLDAHPQFVFCLCGAGAVDQIRQLNNFITQYNLQERFYYLGKRPDFYELVGQVDILFESYPQKGGLIVLFATNQAKAVVGIGSENAYPGTIEQYLDVSDYRQPTDFYAFERESSLLIDDSEYRSRNARLFAVTNYNRRDFSVKLNDIISGGDDYCDRLNFIHKILTPEIQYYQHLFHAGTAGHEFLLRAKVRAFVDSLFCESICDTLITLRSNGLKTLLTRVLRRVRRRI